ncbi:hypothetical protein JCM10908_006803 [Rhodotorula pacifica]|uniref:uncharacterized protein n=1 Tax=Rhodotorula pacifica TaxID=1495444 RepID=UPI00317CA09A
MSGRSAAPAASASAPGVSRLVYATPVHKLSLIIAARAWPRIKRTYRFISLVQARRAKNTLEIDSSVPKAAKRLPNLPNEIWSNVKKHVTRELFEEEQDRFVFQFHGASDDGLWDELMDPQGFDEFTSFDARIGRARLDLKHLKSCDSCSRNLCEESGMIRTFSQHSKEVGSFLADHGLRIACYHLVRQATFDFDDIDMNLDGNCLVALFDRNASANTALNPSPLMFSVVSSAEPTQLAQAPSLPNGADNRFSRLFELMPTGGLASDGRGKSKEKGRKVAGEAREKPGWKTLAAARRS